MPPNNKTPRPDSCPVQGECIYEREKEIFLDSKFLKTAGVIIAFMTPFVTWVVIEIFSLKGQVALIAQRQDTIEIMQRDIGTIKDSLVDLQIKVGKIEQKVDIK
jgi:hypothetical protein